MATSVNRLCLALQFGSIEVNEAKCKCTHNLWTGVALFLEESSHVFYNPGQSFRSLVLLTFLAQIHFIDGK